MPQKCAAKYLRHYCKPSNIWRIPCAHSILRAHSMRTKLTNKNAKNVYLSTSTKP